MVVEVGDDYMVFMIKCYIVGRIKFFLVDVFKVKFVEEFFFFVEELDMVIMCV